MNYQRCLPHHLLQLVTPPGWKNKKLGDISNVAAAATQDVLYVQAVHFCDKIEYESVEATLTRYVSLHSNSGQMTAESPE